MNISKANEIICLNLKEAGSKMPPDVKDALTLAVEAFDIIELFRIKSELPDILKLPSETKD